MHPQKAPQVSSSSPTSIVEKKKKKWTGCWHFANAIQLWKPSPQIITKNSHRSQRRDSSGVGRSYLIHTMSHCVSFPGQPDGQRDGSGLRGIWENRTSAQGCRLQKVKHTKSCCSILLSETEGWQERGGDIQSYCETTACSCISEGYFYTVILSHQVCSDATVQTAKEVSLGRALCKAWRTQ